MFTEHYTKWVNICEQKPFKERILDMVEFTLERQEKKAREEVEDIERGLEVA